MRTDNDLAAKNFGLKERSGRQCSSMDAAVKSLGRELVPIGAASYGSIDKWVASANTYAKWAKSEGLPSNNLKGITADSLKQYGAYLKGLVEAGQLSAKQAHNLISNINSIIKHASRSESRLLDADGRKVTGASVGLPPKSGVATVSKAPSESVVDRARSPVVAGIAAAARDFGLRFRECAKADYRKMVKDAVSKGFVRVVEGTKGGQARIVTLSANTTIRDRQIATLRSNAKLQGSEKSFAARAAKSGQNYKTFREECKAGFKGGFHGLRHSFAQREYFQRVRVACPVVGGVSKLEQRRIIAAKHGVSIKQAMRIDKDARMAITKMLGHHRIDITSAYLG